MRYQIDYLVYIQHIYRNYQEADFNYIHYTVLLLFPEKRRLLRTNYLEHPIIGLATIYTLVPAFKKVRILNSKIINLYSEMRYRGPLVSTKVPR